MHAQNWKQPFDEEVAKAKDRHQQAIAEAHDAFKQAERRAWEKRNADAFVNILPRANKSAVRIFYAFPVDGNIHTGKKFIEERKINIG